MYKLRPLSICDEYSSDLDNSDSDYSLLVDDFIIGKTMQEVVDSLRAGYGSAGSWMVSDKKICIRFNTLSEQDERPITRTLVFVFSSTLTSDDIVFLQSVGFDLVRYI